MTTAAEWETALRNLQRALRAYCLGLGGGEQDAWERVMAAERAARNLITQHDAALSREGTASR